MIFNHTLKSSFVNPSGFSIAGAERVYFVPTPEVRAYAVDANTITGLDIGYSKLNAFDHLEELRYAVASETSRAGTLYSVELTFKVRELDAMASAILFLLASTKQTAIVVDNNAKHRLLGYEQGLVVTYEQNTEDNGYNVKCVCKQDTDPLFVSPEAIAKLGIATGNAPVYDAPDVTPTPPSEEPTSPVPAGGNVLRTVNVAYNNYQLENDHHYAIVPNGYTVRLPISPVNGQEHTVKAAYDASVTPVIVKTSNSLIDGNPDFEINTAWGAATFLYYSNKWLVTNFAL